MSGITNSQRADMARPAIDAFWARNSSNRDAEEDVVKAKDLVTNIMHFLRIRCDLSFEEASDVCLSAIEMAETEMVEEPD